MVAASVLITYALIDESAPAPETGHPYLPAEIARRLAVMRSPSARARSLTGYWLLEQGLAIGGHTAAGLDAIRIDSNGKPQLADGPDFNISHSRGLVACAIGDGCRVGLDVEEIRPVALRRLQRFLNPREAADCARDPAAFFPAWAAREASVKADGRVGLARIAQVEIADGIGRIDGQSWYLQYPALASGYAACLACDRLRVSLRTQALDAPVMKNRPA